MFKQGANIASAATTNLAAATGNYVHITGTTNISAFGTVNAGVPFWLVFDGILTLTHNGTSLILPGAANITTAVGDIILMISEGSGNWRCIEYIRAALPPRVAPAPITNSLGADVLLNNTANYFDGPSVAQGTTGTWFVSGTVTVNDTGGSTIYVKLWDGTTVIASAALAILGAAALPFPVSLSGFISAPSGNLRISVRDITAATGKILFNNSGNSKDSTITAIRIA